LFSDSRVAFFTFRRITRAAALVRCSVGRSNIRFRACAAL